MQRSRFHALAVRGIAVLAGFSIVTGARSAQAHLPIPAADDNMLAVGPSLAAAPGSGARSGFLFGADATLTIALGWLSLGARAQPGEQWNLYPYAEAGVWFGLNLGVGYSLGVGRDAPLQNWHLFVGLPLPIGALGEAPLWFVEPYYRPTMSLNDPSQSPALHELGLLVKWAWDVGASHDGPH
ncbi:MAG TPA: hypothetical protein VFZ53_09180 [Polyangiaceae bacterium]